MRSHIPWNSALTWKPVSPVLPVSCSQIAWQLWICKVKTLSLLFSNSSLLVPRCRWWPSAVCTNMHLVETKVKNQTSNLYQLFLSYADKKCSGTVSCEINIFELLPKFKPCPVELSSYLETSFTCLGGKFNNCIQLILINDIFDKALQTKSAPEKSLARFMSGISCQYSHPAPWNCLPISRPHINVSVVRMGKTKALCILAKLCRWHMFRPKQL